MYTLDLLSEAYAICRAEAGRPIPFEITQGDALVSLTVTREEVSIVCPEERAPQDVQTETGWRALKVAGPLDFGLTGVLASLTSPLAQAGVSVFALSTYDTDYLLVRSPQLAKAIQALQTDGHQVHR